MELRNYLPKQYKSYPILQTSKTILEDLKHSNVVLGIVKGKVVGVSTDFHIDTVIDKVLDKAELNISITDFFVDSNHRLVIIEDLDRRNSLR